MQAGEALAARCNFDLIIADAQLSVGLDGEWLGQLRESERTTAVILLAARSVTDDRIDILHEAGAVVMSKPLEAEQLMPMVELSMEWQRLKRQNLILRRQLGQAWDARVLDHGDLMQDARDIIRRIAPLPTPVLISGEKGSGKTLAARAIHQASGRKGAFAPIDCSLPPEQLENELFGHVRGAFNGARRAREGLLSLASQGTLLLNDICQLPLSLQAQLLHVLDEQCFRPVGSDRDVPSDVRFIAATSRNLAGVVDEGLFRRDLYYRLNVVNMRMPSLRERPESIPELATYFMQQLSRGLDVPPREFSASDMALLRNHHWPGNLRELRNVIERCLLQGQDSAPDLAWASACDLGRSAGTGRISEPLAEVEKRHILAVLAREGGNKTAAARQLGISRKTLNRKLQAWAAVSGC